MTTQNTSNAPLYRMVNDRYGDDCGALTLGEFLSAMRGSFGCDVELTELYGDGDLYDGFGDVTLIPDVD